MGFFDRMGVSPTVEVEVKKFNPYHDKVGRFTTANGATYIGTLSNPDKSGFHTGSGEKIPDMEISAALATSKDFSDFATKLQSKYRVGQGTKQRLYNEHWKPHEALREAFADVWDAKASDSEAYRRRKLNFLSDKSFSPGDYGRVMGTISPRYNNYSAKRVASFLENYPGVKLRPGREMSPSTYVTGPTATLEKLFSDLSKGKVEQGELGTYSKASSNKVRADEVSYHPKGRRIKNYDKKHPTKKDQWGFPEYEDLANIKEPVVRLWWD